jgi:Pretoxin HINT domain
VLGEWADGTNAVWYAGEGDYLNAGLSAAEAIPFAGWGAAAEKLGLKATKKVEVEAAGKGLDDVIGAACSFSSETRVLLADGTTKPISEVTVGDRVAAQDPESGQVTGREVTHVWVHDDDLVRLEIAGAIVRTTEDHPFWNDTDAQWQRADQLDFGDMVLASDGRRIKVGLLLGSAGRGTAYNLTVEGIHTYHVLFGEAAVLVHNACKAINLPPGYKKVAIDLDHVKSGHVAGVLGSAQTRAYSHLHGQTRSFRRRFARPMRIVPE